MNKNFLLIYSQNQYHNQIQINRALISEIVIIIRINYFLMNKKYENNIILTLSLKKEKYKLKRKSKLKNND
jgi:hypothetical protein